MANYKETELLCKRVSNTFASMEDEILAWANSRLKTEAKLLRFASRHEESVARMPENWLPMLLSEYTAASVFSNPGVAKKCFSTFREELPDDAVQLLGVFQRTPWRYRLFTVDDSPQGYFHTIVDAETGSQSPLYSEAVTTLLREKSTLFLSLLFDNGECQQTFGLIHHFREYTVEDILRFAQFSVGRQARAISVANAVKRDPLPMYFLDCTGAMPPVYRGSERVMDIAHSIKGVSETSIVSKALSPICDVTESGHITRYELRGDSGDITMTFAYHDIKKAVLAVRSNTRSLYEKITAPLAAADPRCRPLLEPSWELSIMMSVAIKELLGYAAPGTEYDITVAETSALGPSIDDNTLETLNAAIREITDAHNHGREISIEDVAATYGLERETLENIAAIFDRQAAADEIAIDGGIEGFEPPPPAVRTHFAAVLSGSDAVRFSEAEPEGFGRIINELAPDLDRLGYTACSWLGFPKLIEDLFFEAEQDTGATILMYTLYLLDHAGDQFYAAADYAAEMLRIFWRVLLPEPSPEHISGFIASYASLCISVFHKTGIVEISGETKSGAIKRGEFLIKASKLFQSSISFDWTATG